LRYKKAGRSRCLGNNICLLREVCETKIHCVNTLQTFLINVGEGGGTYNRCALNDQYSTKSCQPEQLASILHDMLYMRKLLTEFSAAR
jgi:hypothetical protein